MANLRVLVQRRRDGTEIVVSNTSSLLRDKDGALRGVVAFNVDTTKERGVEEDRQRLAGIVEGSHDAIISKSLDGIVMSWNKGAERLYGWKAAEVVGRHVKPTTEDTMNSAAPAMSRAMEVA